MFEIKTFLEKHDYDPTDSYFFEHPKEKYVDLNELSKLKDYFLHKDFTPEYIQMLVTITYQNETVIGIDGLSGLDLWNDYSAAIEQYLKNREAEKPYGIDPTILKLTASGDSDNLLHFLLVGEWEPQHIYAEAIFPEKEFLEAMLNAEEHFWQVLIEYKVFEGHNKRKDTPSDYPSQRIKEIKELKEKVKLLK